MRGGIRFLNPQPHFCFTVKTFPATAIIPLRENPVAFGATAKSTTPLPTPTLFPVNVVQLTLLEAIHAQRLSHRIMKLPAPPLDGKVPLVGVIMKTQSSKPPS